MSNKLITDSFSVKKHNEPITKTFPQNKIKKEPIKKPPDQRKKEYKDAKDVNDLSILRDFDMRSEFGPCIGITRLERWKRAEEHDLEPPYKVKDILMERENDTKYTECIWHGEELLS